jgi:hypothetical protein
MERGFEIPGAADHNTIFGNFETKKPPMVYQMPMAF